MYRIIKKGVTALLACAALVVLLAFPTFAAPTGGTGDGGAVEEGTLSLQAAAEAYPRVTLYYGGKALAVTGRRIEGQTLVPLADFTALFMEATYQYDPKTAYATLTAPKLLIEAGQGATYLFANERCLYGVAANRLLDGDMWVSLPPLAKALGLTVNGSGTSLTRTLSGSVSPLTAADDFYRADELYWLSRIISAESRGEPMRGQIAVGNTILNRVRSPLFPNTIYGVIFQKGQFSPVMNGSVYATPAWSSVAAAKMCLEGYAIDNETLFFCNMTTATSCWIMDHRTRAFTLGAHTFFY